MDRAKQAAHNRRTLGITAGLISLCMGVMYVALQASEDVKPMLPPLAAERSLNYWLEQPRLQLGEARPYHNDTLKAIYQRTGNGLLWLNHYELSPAGEALLQSLHETSADQTREYRYHLTYLQQRLHTLRTLPKEVTALDILLTDAFISYAEDVLSGRLVPDPSNEDHPAIRPVSLTEHPAPVGVDHGAIVKLLADNHEQQALTRVVTNMAPHHEGYHQLRQALHHYQRIANSGQWQPLPEGPILTPGDDHEQVAALRRLLHLYGDYPRRRGGLTAWWQEQPTLPEGDQARHFDDELSLALADFQQRHGLLASGVLDEATRQALNVNPDFRVKQLALNMKRWRMLPNDLGERYILVNMPEYRLRYIEDGDVAMEMKVIIGKTYRRTPIMTESVSTVVLNPPWNVPRRIALQDLLPKIRENPDYLRERNIHILKGWENAEEIDPDTIDWANATPGNFPYRLLQDPGEDNALGVVKFVIPNNYAIYLHDTSHPELFDEEFRALSSGCVRVEKPLELAAALLGGKQGWNQNRLERTVASRRTTYLALPEPVPTYLLYWTAWVDDAGRVQFRPDVYQRDALEMPSESAPSDKTAPGNRETLIL